MLDDYKFEDLVGKTIVKIDKSEDNDWLMFTFDNGDTLRMYHEQDCCEHVYIEDINGDLDILLNTPLVVAEESTNRESNPDGWKDGGYQDSFTWTFYRLATINGHVVIRFYGESNGYYSEGVELSFTPKEASNA